LLPLGHYIPQYWSDCCNSLTTCTSMEVDKLALHGEETLVTPSLHPRREIEFHRLAQTSSNGHPFAGLVVAFL
jgi:hypothetical protein